MVPYGTERFEPLVHLTEEAGNHLCHIQEHVYSWHTLRSHVWFDVLRQLHMLTYDI